ncbi:30S ribosomal protein S1 [Candidatus Methylacidiphilum fumarolicum]|uniref:30S ribosomal protein S1 n=2 Tax=Candidatus Methylacidiphilum fumarolicum TaxID=591154 RepID=I0JWH6_METFB|nr:30S ribosomal protein S1 [Candidatus Methylacidiphilum fumarolicum]MBW6415353.1 30S ribosomal protein S1 [Candidatus Methylacidiphilum fumarolicum]TFE68682.1 30S ribosomal protein S1 [Candidatus Methylacidiphilum fumarolicum]TFE72561.1 30S ribosomal protein S1 [Candidatus Methylacidiphilum fumarolicum]TFE73878.1 30S ribosomal protein S1 [Candidatus Methylacidiphilum fumarolicum]TFE77497.1 30S ribosomal protein S1 [Candidatus Methylacidiphilum fumarolicum]
MVEMTLASIPDFVEGSIVKGKVVDKNSKEVVVDIGYKSEGIIPLSEFEEPESIQVGQEIEVLLESLENEEGMVVLSRQKAAQKQNWDKILKTFEEGGTITGKVKQVVKGGLMLNIGVEAFLPASQIDVVPPKNLKEYEGATLTCKIVKISEERKNVVLSRREIVEAERNQKRLQFLEKVHVGDLVKGVVKNVTDFGAFIDLDGIDGLIHITDMSWGRINHPSEILKVGQEIEVVVIDVDREKERVSLGLKQKTPNPWENIEEKYPVGTKVKGKVVNLAPYGAFIELEPGIEGLVHISEISWTQKITKPSEVLSMGQEVEAMVLDINKAEQKLSLSLKALEVNPWDKASELYPPGTIVKGKVKNFSAYGAYIELENALDGFIHVNDLSWTRKINHPSEVLKKGEEIEAKVLEIDKTNQKILLGIKQLTEDPWKEIEKKYKVGEIVSGKVSKIASFGAFIQLADEIDGLVHISQISADRVAKVKDVLKVGQEVSARIIKIDKEERRIGLSIKALHYTPEQLEKEREKMEFSRPAEELGSLEDAFSKAEEDYRPGESKKKS